MHVTDEGERVGKGLIEDVFALGARVVVRVLVWRLHDALEEVGVDDGLRHLVPVSTEDGSIGQRESQKAIVVDTDIDANGVLVAANGLVSGTSRIEVGQDEVHTLLQRASNYRYRLALVDGREAGEGRRAIITCVNKGEEELTVLLWPRVKLLNRQLHELTAYLNSWTSLTFRLGILSVSWRMSWNRPAVGTIAMDRQTCQRRFALMLLVTLKASTSQETHPRRRLALRRL